VEEAAETPDKEIFAQSSPTDRSTGIHNASGMDLQNNTPSGVTGDQQLSRRGACHVHPGPRPLARPRPGRGVSGSPRRSLRTRLLWLPTGPRTHHVRTVPLCSGPHRTEYLPRRWTAQPRRFSPGATRRAPDTSGLRRREENAPSNASSAVASPQVPRRYTSASLPARAPPQKRRLPGR